MNGIVFDTPKETLINCVAVLLGDYNITRKYAASVLLKYSVGSEFYKFLLADPAFSPYKRDDGRVYRWKKEILKIGHCERCGSTEDLEAHHIIKWADYPQGRVDPNNGECLCHACHTEQHRFDPSYYMMKAHKRKK